MYYRVIFLLVVSLFLSANTLADTVSQQQCDIKGSGFIFAGGECIAYKEAKGDKEGSLTIVVHGTWKEGANVLARYATFADDLAMLTDITTVAIALPGYSGSSTNHFQALSHDKTKKLAADKGYIKFLDALITALKAKYKAKTVNYIGHSAGAMMGATLMGIDPGLIQNIALAGGRYDIHEISKEKDLISAVDIFDKIDKDANILLIYGTRDEISKPDVTKDFYALAKKQGLHVSIVEVKDAPHSDLDSTETSMEAISKMLDY
ncbi:alpha/beta fold hydrolase [bacterium]|nr:alpha/beta fold hydrolase [bacterium]MBU1883454.1 alpha/beta fold hydrolase [bacterium]